MQRSPGQSSPPVGSSREHEANGPEAASGEHPAHLAKNFGETPGCGSPRPAKTEPCPDLTSVKAPAAARSGLFHRTRYRDRAIVSVTV